MHSTQHYGTNRGVETPIDSEVTIADADAGPVDERAPFERGETLGRYLVLETLGQGGMGIVLAAYDSKLDRRVALKLLRRHASFDPENHARLLREAQALAKLSHPGVVSVYDVGELRGQVFIAMEYIDGPNLRRWTRDAERTPAEIIAVFRAAAQGLRAAHDAGIVHRDFKPDNVLIGSDGGVRVTDFGLALEARVAAKHSSSGWDSRGGSGRLTETGMVMGTPAYMPIEQHTGHVTDHRSDQFSFCVSFFEALYGVRPFSGNTADEYCLSIRKADIPSPPSNVSVPRRVHRAILKGLESKPEDRHASMQAFIRAMTPRTRHRRTWVLGSLGGLAVGAAAVALVDHSSQPCSAFEEHVAEVYGKEHRRQMLASFTATGLPYAQEAHDTATGRLDDYADRWASAAQNACLASERGEQSDHMLDLRMHCLDRARSRLRATVDVLSDADAGVVREAVGLASSQAELGLCADLELLERTSVLPTDAEEAEDARELFEALQRIEALRASGRKEEAKMLFAELEERVEASAYPPVKAAGLWTRGRLLGTDNKADEALEVFEQAHLTAMEYGLDHLAANASSSLGFYLCEFKSNLALSEHYLDIGLALAKASGSSRVQSSVYANVSALRVRQARFDEAVEAAEKQLEYARAGENPSVLHIAEALRSHAHAIRLRDGPKAAQPLMATSLEYTVENLGRTHPLLVRVYEDLGAIARELGDHERAYIHATAALDQARTLYGADSLDVAYELANTATVIGNLGRKEEALEMFAEADAGMDRDLGADHPVRAALLNNVASVQMELERWEEGEASLLEALRIAKANTDEPNDMVAVLTRNIAMNMVLRERPSDAKPYAEESLEHSLAVYGPENMNTASAYSVVGRVARMQGNYALARGHQERAIEIGHDSDTTLASFEFELGRTLVEDPSASEAERAEGMRLVRKAEKVMAIGEDVETTHRDIVAWLAEHQEGFIPG